MEASTSFQYLQEQGIKSRTFSDNQNSLRLLMMVGWMQWSVTMQS